MKVLKVLTHPYGGAAVAAKRQAEALNELGTDCSVVYVQEVVDTTSTAPWLTYEANNIQINVPGSLWSHHGRLTHALMKDNRTPISSTFFSLFPITTCLDDLLLEVCGGFDVIHFHWIAGVVSESFLHRLSGLGKRIVFTGHDMNHFTGGCHYSAGCERYREDCSSCPQLVTDPVGVVRQSFSSKVDAFMRVPATWLFPSRWLADCFNVSRLCSDVSDVRVLHNCISYDRFFPAKESERADTRRKFEFSADEIVIVAGSADNTEKRKGFSYLAFAVRELARHLQSSKPNQGAAEYVIASFGEGKPSLELGDAPVRQVHLGFLDEEQVVSLLQAADLLLMPSIEENFANVVLEAIHCGCPVLAFRVGGVPDIVEHDINGWIADEVSENGYAEQLLRVLERDAVLALRATTRDWIARNSQRFAYRESARRLAGIYSEPGPAVARIPGLISQVSTAERLVYEHMFGECVPNDVSSHMLTSANLMRVVASPEGDQEAILSSPTPAMPFFFEGFTELSQQADHGLAGWQLQRAYVAFPYDEAQCPALRVRYSQRGTSSTGWSSVVNSLRVSVNGKPAEAIPVIGKPASAFRYLWVLPRADDLEPGRFNIITLEIDRPRVPNHIDPRGLCLRYSGIDLLDNSVWDDRRDADAYPDHALSTLLSFQSHGLQYTWERWSSEDHASVSGDVLIESWSDLLLNAGPQ